MNLSSILIISLSQAMVAPCLNSKQKLTHKEVFETAQRVKNDFAKIVDFAILIGSKNEG